MVQQSPTASAELFDLAVYRMQKLARARAATGATRRFLWVHASVGSVHTVEFPVRRIQRPSIVLAR